MLERGAGTPGYRVVELTDVVDAEIEAALNRLSGEGYRFDSIHFVSNPGSRRPAMAFLFFVAAPEAPAPAEADPAPGA